MAVSTLHVTNDAVSSQCYPLFDDVALVVESDSCRELEAPGEHETFYTNNISPDAIDHHNLTPIRML